MRAAGVLLAVFVLAAALPAVSQGPTAAAAAVSDEPRLWEPAGAFSAAEARIAFGSCGSSPGYWPYLCSLFYNSSVEIRPIAGTGSMWPNLVGGGYVILENVSAGQLAVGDIVIANVSGVEIAHRIVRIGSDAGGLYFVTAGDASPVDDGGLRASQITARVIGILY